MNGVSELVLCIGLE